MRSKAKFLIIYVVSALFTTGAMAGPLSKPVTIGVVVPIELPAMRQIVAGFKSEIQKHSPVPVRFIVKNAQGNPILQRSILEEFKSSGVNIVAPIGTNAAEMAIALIRHKPIIGIAAEHLKSEGKRVNNTNVTGVLDQISIAKEIQFMHAAMPKIKKFTIVYSATNQIMREEKEVVNAAKKYQMSVQSMMITQLPQLYTVSKNIAPNSQGIFILKDLLVVSGINELVDQAREKHIPLVASDDGSVSKGAAFALGVSENQIGVDSGKQALKIINGKAANTIPVRVMTHPHVFLNPNSAKTQNVKPMAVRIAAKKLHYRVINLG